MLPIERVGSPGLLSCKSLLSSSKLDSVQCLQGQLRTGEDENKRRSDLAAAGEGGGGVMDMTAFEKAINFRGKLFTKILRQQLQLPCIIDYYSEDCCVFKPFQFQHIYFTVYLYHNIVDASQKF